MKLIDLLAPERIVDLKSTDKSGAISEMLDALALAPQVKDRKALEAAIRERESILSTGIGLGLAVPHAKIASVTDFVMALGRSRSGIDFDAIDGKPVHIAVMIGAHETQKDQYVRVLAKVAHLLKREEIRRKIISAEGPEEIYDLVRAGS